MKKAVLTLLAGLPALAFAQMPYTITGKAGKTNAPAKAYLNYTADKKQITDSAAIVDGKFTFTGTVKDITSASLLVDYKGSGYMNIDRRAKQDVIGLYLETGKISVISPDSIAKAKVTGTRTNLDNAEFQAYLKPFNDKIATVMVEYNAASAETKKSKEFMDGFMAKYNPVQNERSEAIKTFVNTHPDSYMSLTNLSSLLGYNPEYADAAPKFNALSERVRNTGAGKTFASKLDKWKAVGMGQVAPEFAQADTAGKMVSLSSFRGKYLLIDFWASWCGPCRAENPNVVKAFNKYKEKNFTILGVSLDQPGAKAKWIEAIHKDGLAWTQVSDLKWWDNEVSASYGINAIPINFLLDPNGKIIGKNLRGKDLEDKLAELFGKI